MNAFIRAKRPDNSECTIDLTELVTALDDNSGGAYFFVPQSGEIIFRPSQDAFGIEEDGEDDEGSIPDDLEVLPLDTIPTRERFPWMEEFVETVHSVTARALGNAMLQKKPFRHFKEALFEYPGVREQWFQFEAGKLKQKAITLIESFDWEILEVVDRKRFQSDRMAGSCHPLRHV